MARIRKDVDYRLRVNHKRVATGSGPDREQQFTLRRLTASRYASACCAGSLLASVRPTIADDMIRGTVMKVNG